MSSPAMKMVPNGPGSNLDELPTGATLQQGQFTLESFLSAGGFGITYVARDSLARQVVIKECFPASFCRRSGRRVGTRSRSQMEELRSHVTLFRQEAVNLAKLNHPNIVRVHQVFEDNDTAYIAMDYVRGPDLLETIEGKALRLAPERIMHILDRMLDALSHVHAHGFLHRDVAPDNILLDATSGEPVLIDFGAARKDEMRKSRMLSGLRVVKDGYSPQEFYISGSAQAPFSDLYALAASFSHLITGEPPKTSRERLSAIANRQPDPQRQLFGRVSGYPAGFLAAIDKAMSIFPRDRMQSVADWKAMLADAATPPSARAISYPSAPALTAAAAPAAAASSAHRDWLVRAAAASVLIAGLISAGGNLYDRFWSPKRDSQLLIQDLLPGTEPASGNRLRTAEARENAGRFGINQPDTVDGMRLTDLSGPEALSEGPDLPGQTRLDLGKGAWIYAAAASPEKNAADPIDATMLFRLPAQEINFPYNGLQRFSMISWPAGLFDASPTSARSQSTADILQAFRSGTQQSPVARPMDLDEDYLNARVT